MNRRKRSLERRGRPLVFADAPYAVYVLGLLFLGGFGVSTLIAGAEAASGSFGSVARLVGGGFVCGLSCGVLPVPLTAGPTSGSIDGFCGLIHEKGDFREFRLR